VDGNNIEIARKRTNNYPDHIIIRATTPIYSETSTNYGSFKTGSQERYYLPCPHCNPNADLTGTYFFLEHDIFKFRGEVIGDIPDEVYIECPHCGEEIHEASKTWMMDCSRAYWMSEKGSDTPYIVDEKTKYRSFHLPSYYSPLGFLSWNEAFKDYFKYQRTKDILDYQVYRNQIEGLPISMTGEDMVNRSLLEQRAKESDYGRGGVQVPKEGLILTCGVDVQDDRLELEVLATGVNAETWSVDYVVIQGCTEGLGDKNGLDKDGVPTPWNKLAHILIKKRYRHESGCFLPIEGTFIDAGGHRADEVHQFARAYEKYGVYPCIGRAGWEDGKVVPPTTRHKKWKTKLYKVMKDPMILALYERLNVLEPGPKYQHFPNKPQYGARYFRGLTAERQVIRNKGGKKVLGWECTNGVRNEQIDVRCYAWGAQLACQVSLSLRAEQPYPLIETQLRFWDKAKTPSQKRRMRPDSRELKYMPDARKKRTRENRKARTLSKGI